MKLLQMVIVFAIGLVATRTSYAATVSVGALKDNTIFSESNSINGYNSNGLGGDFGSGRVNNGRLRRGLLQFGLSSIPPTAQIDNVTLRLYLFQVSGNDTVARDFFVHRLTSDWGEGSSDPSAGGAGGGGGGGSGATAQTGDATWEHTFYNTAFWSTFGGDFVPGASASTSVGITVDSFHEWSGPGLVADVQAWIDGSTSNFGWLVRSAESAQGGRRFYSLQSATAAFRPLLTIEYTPVPEPASANLLIAAMVAAWFGRRARLRTP